MLATINSLFMVSITTIGTFMVERYVLLEPPMEAKKQRWLYILCSVCILAAFLCVGEGAQMFALLFGALNILLGRKKHRIAGAFMVIPLIGILNGIAAPMTIIKIIMVEFFAKDAKGTAVQLGTLVIYLIFAAFLVVFYVKGKEWRKWFGENMKDRSPSHSEHLLIYISGIIMMFFTGYSTVVEQNYVNYSPEPKRTVGMLLLLFNGMAFLMAMTLIVLVMQGNRRKFYHDRVSGMQFSVIATMADIVEDRDSNTGGHIKRTAKYVEIIGKYLLAKGEFKDVLTRQYIEDMVVAAPLHDIGKISIPDAILNKPGRLTDEEFAIMKTHAPAGRDVLQKAEQQMGSFDYLEIAKDMAEYHHEWFDGKGYPEGKSGDAIPLCARIMAVADVFDALTSKRCYKAAMPLEKAYDIILSESGTHFDPLVAEAFLNSKAEIEAAMQRFAI